MKGVLKMKEKVYDILNDYCEELEKLCKNNIENSCTYYLSFISKLSGVFDILAYDNSLSTEEYVNLHNECLDKLEEIYNKYNK